MSASGDGADPTPFAWEELSRSWAASLGMWSAWAEAWSSLLTNRGAPAAKTMLDRLAAPASWPNLSEWAKELRVVLGPPVFADLPVLDGAAFPSVAAFFELAAVAQQYLLGDRRKSAPGSVSASSRFSCILIYRI